MGECVRWEELVSGDDVGARLQHSLGKACGVQALSLEVLDHGPGAPTAHEAGMQWINARADEGYAAPVAESPGGDVPAGESQLGTQDGAGGPKGVGDVAGGEPVGCVVHVERAQRCGRVCSMFAKMEHLLEDCLERGHGRVGGVPVGNWLMLRAILLEGKIEGDGRGLFEMGHRAGGPVKGATRGLEGRVLEPERMGIGRRTGAVHAFPRPKNEEVSSEHG